MRHYAFLVAVLVSASTCASEPTTPDVDDTVMSVSVSPASSTLVSIGETSSLSATARTSTGGTVTGVSFTWSSSDAGVATVSSAGLVTAVANGDATISAVAAGVTGSADITVAQAVASVAVTPENPSVTSYGPGGAVALTAAALDAGGTEVSGIAFAWTSSDTQIARVDAAGNVVTLAAGTVAIAATGSGVTGEALVSSTPPAVPTAGLIAHYSFTDAPTDRSGNGHDGTLVGPTRTTDRFGNSEAAFSFDGIDDFIELAGSFSGLSLPFTVSAWIHQPTVHDTCCQMILTLHDPPNPVGNYYGFWAESALTLGVGYGDGGFPSGTARRSGSDNTNLLGADEWIHVAATVRGPTDMTFYKNGVEGASAYSGTGGAMVHNDWPARIGRNAQNTPAQYFEGLLDDIRIFDRSLTAAEVGQLFEEGGYQPPVPAPAAAPPDRLRSSFR